MKHAETTPAVNMTAMLDAVKSKASDETDTAKTGSTPPSSSDTTASSSSTLNDEPCDTASATCTVHSYDDAILAQLARQLEYYFSKANLERDTYVETLRQLNDGCVPVSILQRFSKVQALTPFDTMDAIIKAASDHSSLLQVVAINTKTGKRVADDDDAGAAASQGGTILAVGTQSGEPLDNSNLQSVVPFSPNTPGTPIQNTIIIREVESRVTEAEVRALFDDESFPPIQSLYLDVFNCWFVTLDTTSRDDMLYVMMHLRCQYLGDEPVKARLKSLVRTIDPASAPPLPVLTPVTSYTHLSSLAPHQLSESGSLVAASANNNNGKSNKRKQKKRSKNVNQTRGNNAYNNNGQGNGNNTKKNNSSQQQLQQSSHHRDSASSNASNHKKEEAKKHQPKPDLSAASFPALTSSSSEGTRKVEVVVDENMETAAPKLTGSDSASTATTMSSSSSSESAKGKQQLGGYAAALLKAKPPKPAPNADAKVKAPQQGIEKAGVFKAAQTKENKKNGSSREKESIKKTTEASSVSAVTTTTAKATPVAVKPPAWGGGRSFADVLAM